MPLIQPGIDQFIEPGENQARDEAYFVKRLGGFGDVIMALGALNAIRQARPEAHIYFLTEAKFAPLAQLCPFLTKVYSEPNDFIIALQEWSSNRKKVILCDWTYALFGINRDHQIDAFLKSSGFHAASRHKEAILRFEPATESNLIQKVDKLLARATGRRILLHPSRGDTNRTWPLQYWNELIDVILGQGHTPILVGDNSSIPFKGVLKPEPRPGLLDLTNRLSFLELRVLCQRADVFVSPDSGPVQIAGTTGIGIVALYTTVPARCRLPFRAGYHMWKAIGVEPDCPRKGCYQTLIQNGPGRNQLQAAFRKDYLRPGSQATNKFMGEFCALDTPPTHICLKEMTPQRVWSACETLLALDCEALASHLAAAREALALGHHSEALAGFRACLQAFHLPDVQLDLAATLILSGNVHGALEWLDGMLESYPCVDVFNLMAVATYLLDDAEEAVRLGEIAISWNSNHHPAQANLALFRAHQAFEAGQHLEGLFALEAHFAHRRQASPECRPRMVPEDTAHILKGFLTIGLSQSPQARDSFRAAVELNPTNPLGHFGLAEAHYCLGAVPEAIDCYRHSLEVDATFEPAREKLNLLTGARAPE